MSYHNLSPGSLHKLEIGAIVLYIEGGQGCFHSMYHPGVVQLGQQGAAGANSAHVLGRV